MSHEQTLRLVKIGDKRVGVNQPVYIIAEIGYNFNTVEEAKASIDAAAECGVDAVKFQTFRAETITSRYTDFPAEAGATNQFDEFKRYELSEEAHQILFDHARRRKVTPLSTPSHYDDVELLDRVGCEVYKIGSDDLTNLPFHDFVARRGKPVIFSTGMSNLSEVAETMDLYRAVGNEDVVVLHCLSNYPIQDMSLVNLRAIESLQKAFHVPVGFSDHTIGLPASIGAVALGACVIEKHFTIDKKLPAPDAFFSADPTEMKALVRGIRELEQALGDGIKRFAPTEIRMRLETRKSLIARIGILAGETLTADKVIVKRPGTGIPPKFSSLVMGRHVIQDIKVDEPVTWEKLG